MKDALWGGGGTHRSWPGGRGGRPRALISGEGEGKGRHGAGLVDGGQGGGARARGGCKGFGSGGVGGRGTGPRDGANFATCVVALIQGVREGLAWQAKTQHPTTELAWWTGGQGGGARARGGCKGFGSGGVGGRGTGPRDGANFATCVIFLLFVTRTKRKEMVFFEGCPVGWGGYPPELAWWTGG